MEQKRFAPKLHIKSGDKVQIITGKSKGKQGVITKVFPSDYRALVEGLNMVTKHRKPTQQGEKGEIVQMEAPIHISNLMLVDPVSGKPTRVGRRLEGDKLVRYAKKSNQTIQEIKPNK